MPLWFCHEAAHFLRFQQQGIKVVAIGIGSGVNMAEILGMAYDTNHAFTASSFSTLNTLQAEIRNETCEGKISVILRTRL